MKIIEKKTNTINRILCRENKTLKEMSVFVVKLDPNEVFF